MHKTRFEHPVLESVYQHTVPVIRDRVIVPEFLQSCFIRKVLRSFVGYSRSHNSGFFQQLHTLAVPTQPSRLDRPDSGWSAVLRCDDPLHGDAISKMAQPQSSRELKRPPLARSRKDEAGISLSLS